MDAMVSVLLSLQSEIIRLGSRFGHIDDGEELFAQVALACVEKASTYDWNHPRIRGLVITIAINLRNALFRKQATERAKRVPLPIEVVESGRNPAALAECHELVSRTLKELSPADRKLLEQRYILNRSYKEIAGMYCEPAARLRLRCWRLLGNLRDRCADRQTLRFNAPSQAGV